MPVYGYACVCGQRRDIICAIADRNNPVFCDCNREMQRQLDAPLGRIRGVPLKDGSGGADQFTADMLGMKLKDLPAGLKSKP